MIKEMEKDIADDVKELMTHPEQEAGGMMTTSYLSFSPQTTVREALDEFRREAADVDLVYREGGVREPLGIGAKDHQRQRGEEDGDPDGRDERGEP